MPLAAVLVLIHPGYTVRDLGFGFNGYIVSLPDAHRFRGGSVDLNVPVPLAKHLRRIVYEEGCSIP